MFDDRNASISQRGIDDALACQDMLARAPAPPSLRARLRTRLETTVHGFMNRWTGSMPTRARSASLELNR